MWKLHCKCIELKSPVFYSQHTGYGFLARFKDKEHFQRNQAKIDGSRGGKKAKFFMNRRKDYNKDLKAKEKAAELTV